MIKTISQNSWLVISPCGCGLAIANQAIFEVNGKRITQGSIIGPVKAVRRSFIVASMNGAHRFLNNGRLRLAIGYTIGEFCGMPQVMFFLENGARIYMTLRD